MSLRDEALNRYIAFKQRKPSNLKRMFGSSVTPEQAARHKQITSEWTREHARLHREFKKLDAEYKRSAL